MAIKSKMNTMPGLDDGEIRGRAEDCGMEQVKLSSNLSITTVILIGYPNTESFRLILFMGLLVIYCVTICGNLLIISLVSISQQLHTPMYFFLTQVSISDFILITVIVPNTLRFLLSEVRIMCLTCCIAQYNAFSFAICSECLLLTVMAFDRYLAICNPLRYKSIMSFGVCSALASLSWILSFLLICIETITISKLQFCGPNVINHFFCDVYPLLEFSCTDTTVAQLEITILIALLVVVPFILIVISYTCIISTILKIQSLTRRRKVFSTCSSHLTVVCIFYGTVSGIYMLPSKGKSLTMTRALSLFYTVGTPLVNPIVYSLRNKELSKAYKKIHSKVLDAT